MISGNPLVCECWKELSGFRLKADLSIADPDFGRTCKSDSERANGGNACMEEKTSTDACDFSPLTTSTPCLLKDFEPPSILKYAPSFRTSLTVTAAGTSDGTALDNLGGCNCSWAFRRWSVSLCHMIPMIVFVWSLHFLPLACGFEELSFLLSVSLCHWHDC